MYRDNPGKLLIFTNGEYNEMAYYQQIITGNEYIIAVDGGADFMDKLGLIPDLLLGDMDSISDKVYTKYQQMGVSIKKFSADKDESDLELAISEAIKLQPEEILIYGGFGARVDHQIANIIVLLDPIKHGITTWLQDEQHKATIITDKLLLQANSGDYLSLFPLCDKVTDITATGLKYPLNRDTLWMGPSRGLSNEFIEEAITISIGSGYLLAIITDKNQL